MAFGVLLALVAVSALALRPGSEFGLWQSIYGEPVRLGVLISTSPTSVNNSTTATPFTLPVGGVLKVLCNAKAFITPGATASATYTDPLLGHPALADAPYYLTPLNATTQIASLAATGTTNCTVWHMR